MTDVGRLHTIADWLGMSWTSEQEAQFLRFATYLSGEGIQAGGLGPHEADRVMDRHVCDSLVYLVAITAHEGSVIDVGSGMGLPGIPMAIARPDLNVTLLDRSQRRTDLASRAIRILGIENAMAAAGDVGAQEGAWDIVTFRASLGLADAAEAFRTLAQTSGIGVFGVSRVDEPPRLDEPPPGVSFELRKEAEEILDSPSWLLRMRHV